ncbi:hypothetical protein COCC4DRAFT_127096 [Bipolaris maydis ATCC 48331]|uniref:Ubiquitin 3 binding protein But2 C-terminal domain-containing protein n=2 Tax=Cochliobolus heterostrophus TaxID=5016 RepID=M2URJ0_COCH5|nr:uncharacterized protein COCC4DRAFT_127096 [Bipolaris maydis ATCC 48331]EMD90513.1 hypothetical protein COCHEDRAFT_1106753 [Bipolaris maydis C5]ENI09274.1 hypothetical protein COCC4DRAFT_127096 [Bipolaris maydis ATCC 48331]KAJ6206416.1 hypothetical protein PSV09DRAFT_1106753 [Bipolaris maydis]
MRIIAILSAFAATTIAIVCPTSFIQPYGDLPKSRSFVPRDVFQISRVRPTEFFVPDGWAATTARDKCTVFNIPFDTDKARGKTCNLVFNFPNQKQAPGITRMIGPGRFTFYPFAHSARIPLPIVTNWNNKPPISITPPILMKQLAPGNSYVLSSGPCFIGREQKGMVVRSGMLCSENTLFQFKQSNYKCPMGLYLILSEPDGSD